uniref:Mitochondrial peculiar membrane protein 1 n=1 Tax=Myoviridae sp. ctrCp2 TaxID=2825179 RepID=A0A8S5NYN7_9CAUD|nr:MAG TPA: Mitochondrial peculiar membrane protein 1 [Myoviridae sp. ctrCp2]
MVNAHVIYVGISFVELLGVWRCLLPTRNAHVFVCICEQRQPL